jgi:hypothetical protein
MNQDPLDRMLASWRVAPPDALLARRIVGLAQMERPNPRTLWRGAAMLMAAGIAGFVLGVLEPPGMNGRSTEALALQMGGVAMTTDQSTVDPSGVEPGSWLFGAAGPLGGDAAAVDGIGGDAP